MKFCVYATVVAYEKGVLRRGADYIQPNIGANAG
jgi:hypothetical protein